MRGFTLKTAARQVDPGELAAGHHPSDGPDSSSRASAAANANSATSVPVLWIVCAILAILVVITGSIGLVIRAKCQSTRSSTSSSSNGKDATVHFTKKAPEVYGGQQATFRRSSHSMATVALTSSSPTHNNPDRNPDLIPDKGRHKYFTHTWHIL